MRFQDRVYGEVVIDDPCAIAIIESPAFDRLWRVNQYGPICLADSAWSASRAEHCIGVYHLLGLMSAGREERLAGLVHDANHLAFSHLVDWLVGDSATQESHGGFVANPHLASLKTIIDAHGLDGAAIMDADRHSLLEQDAPAMCADRVDYTMRDGICAEQITPAECAEIVAVLKEHHGIFTFTSLNLAEKFSRLSVALHIVREGLWQNSLYATFGTMLKDLMHRSILSREDFLNDDAHVMQIIRGQTDPRTVRTLAWVADGAPIHASSSESADYHTKAKVRFIDPHVLTGDAAVPTSSLLPGLARFLKDYALLRQNTLHVRLPEAYRDIAPQV